MLKTSVKIVLEKASKRGPLFTYAILITKTKPLFNAAFLKGVFVLMHLYLSFILCKLYKINSTGGSCGMSGSPEEC